MKRVKDVLKSKGVREIYDIGPDSTVFDAIRLMSEKRIGALLVIEDDVLVGIISERDYLRKVALLGRSSDTTLVKEIMTPDPITVEINERMEHCMEFMIEKRIRHLPVMQGDDLLGVVSIGDMLVNVLEDQKSTIHHLEGYIRGESR